MRIIRTRWGNSVEMRRVFRGIKKEEYVDEKNQKIIENQEKIIKNQEKIIERIVIAESNLNYYNMIHRIMKENKYVNLELLMLQLSDLSCKKVLIAGFFGAYNLGDELMLQTILQKLTQEQYNKVTVLLCDNEEYDCLKFPGVNFLHYPKNQFDFNMMAKVFDVLIWGGGALIDDCNYEKGNKSSYLLGEMFVDLSVRFIRHNKQVVAISVSSNKYLSNEKYINGLKFVIDNSSFFSVRDKYTQNLLTEIVSNKEKVLLMKDILFSNIFWNQYMEGKSSEESKTVGIVFVCLPETEIIFKKLVSILLEKLDEDYKIKCIPFYDYNKNDYAFYKRIASEPEFADRIEICEYANDLQTVINEIEKVEYMINMRYHAMIISGLLEKKSLNISFDQNQHYYNKVTYVAEQFSMQDTVQTFTELENTQIAKLVIEKLLQNKNRPIADKVLYAEEHNKMMEILDEYI